MIRLVPFRDVETREDGFVATGAEPWLDVVDVDWAALAGRFVTIIYSASHWDAPQRPVFRFRGADGVTRDRIAPGAVAGTGLWTGRVPTGTVAALVSPTNAPGRFGFRIDTIRRRRAAALLAEGWRWNRKSARSALLTRLIGWKPESDVNLMWAIGSRPLATYEAWRARRERAIERDGLDRPRSAWAASEPIQLFVIGADDPIGLRATLASLEDQMFPHWTTTVVAGAVDLRDARLHPCSRDAALVALDALPTTAIACVMPAGTILRPEALAVIAERAAASRGALFYGDATHRRDGGLEPVLRPGWSPRLQQARPYVGIVFARDLAAWTEEERRTWLASGALPASVAARLPHAAVIALRRVLAEEPAPSAPAPSPPNTPAPMAMDALVSIVIPTRDHPALLRRVVASIRARSKAGRYEIVVADNGSVDPETLALLDALRHAPDSRVVAQPGPFNFSRLCNEAAAVSRGTVLLFLNDDTEVVSDGWLERLAGHALDPAIGAVGARLTYPDGRLQHVGVLVGMGESAGHFGALAAGDDPGWAGRNAVVHEVSAVTGACLAVARDKFEAVGGFDAEHLPIELSDIDLCLKLGARGWQAIVDPAVHLMHEESVSRGGATLRRLDVYDSQRAVFVARWRHVLRDDPVFHPGLSLYRWHAALG